MIEIRYRTTDGPLHRGLASWFASAPHARLDGSDVRFRGESGVARLVVTGGSEPLDRALDRAFPGAFRLRLLHAEGASSEYEVRWREPLPGGGRTQLRLAHDLFGGNSSSSFTVDASGATYRVLVPPEALPEDFGRRLVDGLAEAPGDAAAPPRVEIERLAPYAPDGLMPFEDAQRVVAAAVALGYYDEPPRASVHDVSVATGVPARAVRAQLAHVERAILGGAQPS